MESLSSFMNTIRFNFLYIDKYSFGRTWIYPESAIPYNMLRYVIDGSAEFMVDDESVIVKKGQVSYIPTRGMPAFLPGPGGYVFLLQHPLYHLRIL